MLIDQCKIAINLNLNLESYVEKATGECLELARVSSITDQLLEQSCPPSF